MWAPQYEAVFYNNPMIVQIQQQPLLPLCYPLTISTFPIDLFSSEKQEHIQTQRFQQQINNDKSHQLSAIVQRFTEKDLVQIIQIIKFLIRKTSQDTKSIEDEIFQNYKIAKTLGKHFFGSIICKLKKLTKTKQQIIKYCLRRAFKFINKKLQQDNQQLSKDDTLNGLLQQIYPNDDQNNTFKQHSHYKRMNSHFISKLFQSSKFSKLYRQFLKVFPNICQIDNEKKIDNLGRQIFKHLKASKKECKRFNNFKRIPWTTTILQKCILTAIDLQKYGVSNEAFIQSCSNPSYVL